MLLLQPIPSRSLWGSHFGNETPFLFAVELMPGQPIEGAYEIDLTIVGCDSSAKFKVSLPQDEAEANVN